MIGSHAFHPMDIHIEHSRPFHGALRVPPDKSICQRAVLLAALAEGETEIRPWPSADDCQRTLQVIQELGLFVRATSGAVWVRGGGADGLHAPAQPVSCGESGTTFRLTAGVLAGQPFTSDLSAVVDGGRS